MSREESSWPAVTKDLPWPTAVSKHMAAGLATEAMILGVGSENKQLAMLTTALGPQTLGRGHWALLQGAGPCCQ